MARVPPMPRRIRLVSALLACLCLPGQAEDLPGLGQGTQFIDAAPDAHFDAKQGCIIAPKGFVAHKDDWMAMGDAARIDMRHSDFYIKGRAVIVLPGVRLHADRLGYNHREGRGDAWEVEVFVDYGIHRLVLRAKRAHLERQVVVLDDVSADGGHGSVIGFRASAARIYLREKPAQNREGMARQLEGVALVNTRGELMGVPVLYMPYLYRDFTLIYPWTYYEVGASKRQGSYVHAWIGTEFPEIWGWTPGLDVRGDLHSRNGEAMGLRGYWRNAQAGAGELTWYRLPHEQLRDPKEDDDEIAMRGVTVIDAEQRLHGALTGMGAGAISARWVTLPDPDLKGFGGWNALTNPYTNTGPGPDERFRGDFMREDLDSRPFARRGVTATWGNSLGAITLDTERHPQSDMPTTERWWGLEAILPDARLVGPIFVDGSAWAERLVRPQFDGVGNRTITAATRSTFDGALGIMQWLGPVGFDAAGGVRGIAYNDGMILDARQDTSSRRHILYATSGVRLRFMKDFGGGVVHNVIPRVGMQALGLGHGDILPSYGFGDSRDYLDEDKRYGVTSLTTDLSGAGRSLFVGSLLGRWALRDRERTYRDESGLEVINRHRLVDVSATMMGAPTANTTLTGMGSYNALAGQWSSLDLFSTWRATNWFYLRYRATMIPSTPTTGPIWQCYPGVSVVANRYRYDFDWKLQPGGAAVDKWQLLLTRRAVDGEFFFFGDFVRNDDGSIYDKRVGVGVSLTLGGTNEVEPNRNGRGGSFRPRNLP